MLLFLLNLCSLDIVLKSVAGQYPKAIYVAIFVEVVQFRCCLEVCCKPISWSCLCCCFCWNCVVQMLFWILATRYINEMMIVLICHVDYVVEYKCLLTVALWKVYEMHWFELEKKSHLFDKKGSLLGFFEKYFIRLSFINELFNSKKIKEIILYFRNLILLSFWDSPWGNIHIHYGTRGF